MVGSIETLRQNVTALNVTSPVGAEIARETVGNYRGEQVQTSSEASKLQDAAEEIGMSVAHKADKRSLGQREVRQGQGISLKALSRIADYYDKLPDMPREVELQSLIEDLQNMARILEGGGGGGGGVTADDILAALQTFDPDVTHQFAALDVAREFFAAAGADEAFQLLLDGAHAEFQKGDLGRDVRAGFASSQAASLASATLESDPAAVRETYRQLLREPKSMGQLFDAFLRFDMMKNFDEVVEIFMTTAGRDLGSTGPSTDPTHLNALLKELGSLKKMQSVVDMSVQLIQTTDRLMLPGERRDGEATDVASHVLGFASKAAAGPADAQQMLSPYKDCSLATQVSFANGVRALHGELPDEIMPSPQARLQQNTAILGLLDTLVAAEEAEYAEEDRQAAAQQAGDGRKALTH